MNRRFSKSRHRGLEVLNGNIIQIDLDVSRSADTFDQLLRHLEPDIIDLLRRNLTAAFDGCMVVVCFCLIVYVSA